MPRDPRDYKLDLSQGAQFVDAPDAAGRPFVSVRFTCCNIYLRIYRSNDGSKYEGRCPRCGKPVRFLIGDGGTDQRFFVVE